MLLQFTIKNHSSFHGETTLDLCATNNTEHVYSLIKRGSHSVVPVIAIYGANGAGKSNYIESLLNVIDYMRESIDMGKSDDDPPHPFLPFMFSSDFTSAPIESEIVFLIENTEYRYGFAIQDNAISLEYLDCIPPGKKSYVRIFLREKGRKLVIGTSSAVTDWERNVLKVIEPILEDTDLLLTFLCRRQGDEEDHRYKKISSWLRHIYKSPAGLAERDNINFPSNSNLKKLYEDPEHHKKHIEFVRKADPAIQDLTLRKKTDSTGKDYYEVYSKHRMTDSDSTIDFPTILESDGTTAAIKLYPSLYNTFNRGGVLVVDELDRSLHPLLLLEIIRMFTNPEINTNGAQLICTLHNVLMMDRKNLRRDEIWFVEKNDLGESELFSLADIVVNDKKVRNDVDYCKQYILGTFGAVPKFESMQ